MSSLHEFATPCRTKGWLEHRCQEGEVLTVSNDAGINMSVVDIDAMYIESGFVEELVAKGRGFRHVVCRRLLLCVRWRHRTHRWIDTPRWKEARPIPVPNPMIQSKDGGRFSRKAGHALTERIGCACGLNKRPLMVEVGGEIVVRLNVQGDAWSLPWYEGPKTTTSCRGQWRFPTAKRGRQGCRWPRIRTLPRPTKFHCS